MPDLTAPLVLGEGVLTWPPEERLLGRWGSVGLDLGDGQFAVFKDVPIGALAKMTATVLKVRTTLLRPDPVRQLVPTTPALGEEIELGIGQVFQPDLAGRGNVAVGLAPLAEFWKANEWLSPTGLIRGHNHLVRLTLHPYRGFTTDVTRTADAA
ncbi:hypothetical protein AB0B28_06460 [Glycomyces sp. NPDC046736]|uniref:hypothetical protein n=1 Tax=Glycomyces sp. NPDC046736 TaxID=3155615 RepID=UPI003405E3A4